MKKLFTLLFLAVTALTLSACTEQGIEEYEVLSSTDALVSMSYLSAGFLDTTDQNVQASLNMSLQDYLNDEPEEVPETEFETEIDEVNVYLEKLKGFIENGPEGLGSVQEEVSDREEYENKLTLTVEDETYVLYYSVDVDGNISGVFVIGVVEYVIEATNTLEDSQEISDEVDDECDPTIDEDCDLEEEPEDEEDSSLEEVDEEEENEQKMVLVATNGMDSITITYKVETEEDEQTTKFELVKDIEGVVSEVSIKISQEENEYKVDIEDGENSYTFKMEDEDGEVMYKLQYVVNGVRGQVKIKIRVDEVTGEEFYAYQIIENGKRSDTERGKPESYGWGDDDEDEVEDENSEEENTEEGTNEV